MASETRILLGRLSLALLAGLALPAAAAPRLAGVFGDGMVLQRDQAAPVWGWADPDEVVTVAFAGQSHTTKADTNGAWRVTLAPLPASGEPRTMTVQSGAAGRPGKIGNVLVGDVWLVSGDFGACWETWACIDADRELPAADHPSLRLLKIASRSSNQPLDDVPGEWRTCTPESVRAFSALGYFFGRALNRELGVPVGVIEASYRYSVIQGWMPPAAFRMIPELSKPRDRMDSWDATTPVGRAAYSAAIARVEAWLPAARQSCEDGRPIAAQPLLPAPLAATDRNFLSISELSLHYQAMIHPLIPMRIRGVVWSLGENAGLEWGKSFFYLKGLILSWRQAWGQGDFPFYLELVPRNGAPNAPPDPARVEPMRDGQLRCLSLPNTGVAVSYDVSDYLAEVRNRQDPAERLARLALAQEYGRSLARSGPAYRSHRVEGDHVVIDFDHADGGLIAGEKRGLAPVAEVAGGSPGGFAIAGEDRRWHWADARIVGDSVVVRSERVATPAAVRYGIAPNPGNANLYSGAGLPATPFRTDAW